MKRLGRLAAVGVIWLTILGATITPRALAGVQYRDLNAVASIFAQRSVVARCMTQDEKDSPFSYNAWGYVLMPTGKQRAEQLDTKVCLGARGVNDASIPRWQRALGVMVLIHESYHLRRWGYAGDEAKVQCQAIRHWKVAARLMGASEEAVAELWPWALAAHYEEANLVDWFGNFPYRYDACQVPWLEPDLP